MRLLSTLQTALESDFWQPYPCAADFDLAYLHELEPFLPHSLPKLDATLEELRRQRVQQSQLEVPAGAEVGEARAMANPFDHYSPKTVQLPAPVSGVVKETDVVGERYTAQGGQVHVMTAGTIKAARLMGVYLELPVLIGGSERHALQVRGIVRFSMKNREDVY